MMYTRKTRGPKKYPHDSGIGKEQACSNKNHLLELSVYAVRIHLSIDGIFKSFHTINPWQCLQIFSLGFGPNLEIILEISCICTLQAL